MLSLLCCYPQISPTPDPQAVMKLEAPFDVANTNATRLAGLLLLPLLALLPLGRCGAPD